jgi:hypothetical protein
VIAFVRGGVHAAECAVLLERLFVAGEDVGDGTGKPGLSRAKNG